jgi:hypothetical protein
MPWPLQEELVSDGGVKDHNFHRVGKRVGFRLLGSMWDLSVCIVRRDHRAHRMTLLP